MTVEPTPVPPASPIPTAPPRRRSNRLLDIALAAAAVLAIGGVAFAAGRATAPPAAAAGFVPGGAIVRPNGSFDPNALGGAGNGPRFAFGGSLTLEGTITAIDADSLTLTTADGREMTFELDGATAYHQATDTDQSDVAVGDDVSVQVGTDGLGAAPGASAAPSMSASDVTVSR